MSSVLSQTKINSDLHPLKNLNVKQIKSKVWKKGKVFHVFLQFKLLQEGEEAAEEKKVKIKLIFLIKKLNIILRQIK